jgi:hypothetical protein
MNTRNNRNSLDWIHFSFGAVVGAIEGARAAFSLVSHWWSIVLMIVGAAVVLGFRCGCSGDNFWELLSSFDWF